MEHIDVKSESIKAANRSQFKSNYPYDHKSYEDGFLEGYKTAESNLEKRLNEDVTRFFRTNILKYCNKDQMTDLKEWINTYPRNI